jgi:EAL domain-containing protein (putative c-di-GMP-specific phosphodiesterase class I)
LSISTASPARPGTLRAGDREERADERAIVDAASEVTMSALRRVAELGVTLAIDDFGSGFSSFAYLRHLPVHTVKIDSSFIGRIGHNRDDEVIIKGMIELSHALGKRVVAEGVETRQQLDFLRAQSCDEAQGFFLAPPVEADAVSHWLARVVVAEPRVAHELPGPAAIAVAHAPERLSA